MPAAGADKKSVEQGTLSGEDLLTNAQVAELWKVGRNTIDRERLAGNLTGIQRGNAYLYRRSEALTVGAARHAPTVANQRDTYEGDRDARVFAAFNDGCNIAETVVLEHIAVGTVARLHADWMTACASKTPVCVHHNSGDCSGAPQMTSALCAFHASRTQILTEAQRLLIGGKSIPTALQCDTCHKATARGLCTTCLSVIHTTVEGVGLGRRLVMRVRDKVIAIIPAERARALARELLAEELIINEKITVPPKTPEQVMKSAEQVFENAFVALPTTAAQHQTDRPLPEGDDLQDLLRSLGISGSNGGGQGDST